MVFTIKVMGFSGENFPNKTNPMDAVFLGLELSWSGGFYWDSLLIIDLLDTLWWTNIAMENPHF